MTDHKYQPDSAGFCLVCQQDHNAMTDKQDSLDAILESVFAYAADKNGSDDYRSRGKMDIPAAKVAINKIILEEVLKIVDECDPSTGSTSKVYWGNVLREQLIKKYGGSGNENISPAPMGETNILWSI